jgi:AcrR family transcriptional regulator
MTGEPTEGTRRMRPQTAGDTDDVRPELARLPKGRHGLPREFISRNHRERLIAGLAEAIAQKGYAETTISDIAREAAVSRRTFYEHFDSKEQCFLAAYRSATDRITQLLRAAFEAESRWSDGLQVAFASLLGFLVREPALARLSMVEGTLADPCLLDPCRPVIDALIELLRPGRDEPAAAGSELPPSLEETLAGGVASLISRRIRAGETEQLLTLLPDIVTFVLTPYVGTQEAARLARAAN